MNINQILDYEILNLHGSSIIVYDVLGIIFLYLLLYFMLWGAKRYLKRQSSTKRLDRGKSLAIYKIIKYFLITIVVILSLDSIGVKVTILLASSTALFVGIGLGLQQTFNDFISGFILLFEGSISIGDIVEIDGIVGRVEKIDLRTSKISTRDNTVIILPNSALANNNLINWSLNKKATRFSIDVGVAYGSDTNLVSELLKEATVEHVEVIKNEPIQIRFENFGNSSLDFSILFFSHNMFEIEKIKSEIRFIIDEKFRTHGITIPFPQQDLHLYKHDS